MRKLYAERDIVSMDENGDYYCKHVDAMTREGLHSKSEIAAELGYRDMVIDEAVSILDKIKEWDINNYGNGDSFLKIPSDIRSMIQKFIVDNS